MSQVRRAACAGLLRGTWRTKGSDGKGRRVSIEGLPTHLARRPIEDKVEKSIGHVWAVHLSLHVERNPRAVSAHDAAIEPAAPLQCLPDHDNQYGYRSRWPERTDADAVGLVPSWWKKKAKEMPATFNARVETVTEKPMFRSAFKRTRCLIPVSGYYEWRDTAGGKQPYYFTRRDGQVITIAGLWDEWKDTETGEPTKSCTMIITAANDFVAEVHDRMPVILEPAGFDGWLDRSSGIELLTPAPNDLLVRWPVSKRVNSSRASDEDPTLIDRIELATAS